MLKNFAGDLLSVHRKLHDIVTYILPTVKRMLSERHDHQIWKPEQSAEAAVILMG